MNFNHSSVKWHINCFTLQKIIIMKKNAIKHARLTSLNGQEFKKNNQQQTSAFDDALKGLGVSHKKEEKKKKSVSTN